jgi:hypothetical protein
MGLATLNGHLSRLARGAIDLYRGWSDKRSMEVASCYGLYSWQSE